MMRPQVMYCSAPDGVRIAYAVYGPPSAPPIVFIRSPQWSHIEREWEMPLSHHEYEAFVPHFRVIRFDPRGCGLSQRDARSYSLRARRGDLEAVLAATGDETVAIDAISSAAPVALAFAANAGSRVRSLSIQNTYISGRDWWAVPGRRSVIEAAKADWHSATEFWAWLAFGSTTAEQVRELAEHTRACLDGGDFLRMVEVEQTFELAELAARVDASTLVVTHERFTQMASPDESRALAKVLPHSTVVSVRSTSERVAELLAFHRGAGASSAQTSAAGPNTEREQEVLALVVEGLTNKEIADRLVISSRTVDSHVSRLFAKAGVHNRAALVAFAFRSGIAGTAQ